jgi:hypothetical protein
LGDDVLNYNYMMSTLHMCTSNIQGVIQREGRGRVGRGGEREWRESWKVGVGNKLENVTF